MENKKFNLSRRDFLKLSGIFTLAVGSTVACGPTTVFAPTSEAPVSDMTPEPTEIPQQMPEIEPLTSNDVDVFLQNCIDCEPLGITKDKIDGAYFSEEGHFLFHAVDKNGADYFYINQNKGSGFEPLDWMDLGSGNFALISKVENVEEQPKFYFTWSVNQDLDSELEKTRFVVTYQPDGTSDSANNYIVPNETDIHTILKRARINRPIEAIATPEVVNMTLEDWKMFFDKKSDAVMGKRLNQIFEPKFSDHVLYGEEGSKILEGLDKNRPYVILSTDGQIIFNESYDNVQQSLTEGSIVLVSKNTDAPAGIFHFSLIAANFAYEDGNVKPNGEAKITIKIKTEEVNKIPRGVAGLSIDLNFDPPLLVIVKDKNGKLFTPVMPESPLQVTLFNHSGDALTVDLGNNPNWIEEIYEHQNKYNYLIIFPKFKEGASVY